MTVTSDKKNMEKTTNQINKLCNEYGKKIAYKKAGISMLLIEFAEMYNNIWREHEAKNQN